jgi:hypothetical protein
MTENEMKVKIHKIIAENSEFTTWTISTPHLMMLVQQAIEEEREAMMQLFTDPENQPTQYGTVTLEFMQREIAEEREACAQLVEDFELVFPGLSRCGNAIRARDQQ